MSQLIEDSNMALDVKFELSKEEKKDTFSDDSLFNIMSWGADLSFREIIMMYEDDELVKPELQRNYVWDKNMASRFIESILLGLPVPSVFFAQAGSQKLIVDGYQRIMTVYDFVRGIWSKDGKIFKLTNSELINERWRNKSFAELSNDDQRRIKSTTIHVIMFEQKKPQNDDTSLYQIFERINTGGRTLAAQEIRNCIYQGSFNKLLFELNEDAIWRKLFGSTIPDSRMRDLECILRFFTLKSDLVQKYEAKQISLNKTLSLFMSNNKDAGENEIKRYKEDFLKTMKAVNEVIGDKAFRNYSNGKYSNKFHPAIFDAISIGVFQLLEENNSINPLSDKKHVELLLNPSFKEASSNRTTNVDNIKLRIDIVKHYLLEE